MFVMLAITHTIVISGVYELMPLCYTMVGVLPVFVIGGLIYANKSKKMKEAMRLEREIEKENKQE